jgi:hypothetical protein
MNTTLRQLKQKMKIPDRVEEQPPVQEDDSGLAAAISALVQREVQKQTTVARQPAQQRLQEVNRQVVESMPPPADGNALEHLKDFGAKQSSDWPAPPATTPIAKDLTVNLTRGADGKVRKVSVGRTEFEVQRDKAGRAIRMIEV